MSNSLLILVAIWGTSLSDQFSDKVSDLAKTHCEGVNTLGSPDSSDSALTHSFVDENYLEKVCRCSSSLTRIIAHL